jgi:hypothetical protein
MCGSLARPTAAGVAAARTRGSERESQSERSSRRNHGNLVSVESADHLEHFQGGARAQPNSLAALLTSPDASAIMTGVKACLVLLPLWVVGACGGQSKAGPSDAEVRSDASEGSWTCSVALVPDADAGDGGSLCECVPGNAPVAEECRIGPSATYPCCWAGAYLGTITQCECSSDPQRCQELDLDASSDTVTTIVAHCPP